MSGRPRPFFLPKANSGSSHPSARLDEEAVRRIRASLDRPIRQIAEELGVSKSTVGRVRAGQSYIKHDD